MERGLLFRFGTREFRALFPQYSREPFLFGLLQMLGPLELSGGVKLGQAELHSVPFNRRLLGLRAPWPSGQPRSPTDEIGERFPPPKTDRPNIGGAESVTPGSVTSNRWIGRSVLPCRGPRRVSLTSKALGCSTALLMADTACDFWGRWAEVGSVAEVGLQRWAKWSEVAPGAQRLAEIG